MDNDAGAVLSAVNDKAITRLVVPDGEPNSGAFELREPAAAGDRISSAFAYSASGRVANPDVRLSSSNERTEVNATMTLCPDRAMAMLTSSEGPGDSGRASRDPAATDRKRFTELSNPASMKSTPQPGAPQATDANV